MRSELLLFAAFVLPGFVAWKVGQLRLPKGEQKPQDVILEIVGYGVANALIATILGISPIGRSTWPSDDVEVLNIFAAIFLLPIVLSLFIGWISERLAKARLLVPGYPTAWDRLVLARLRKLPFFVAVTLRDGRKIGGAFLGEAFASNYPYEHDVLVDEVWNIDQATGRFVERADGQAGLYVRGKDILTLEIFEQGKILEEVAYDRKDEGADVMRKDAPPEKDESKKPRMIVLKEGRIFPGGGASGPTVIMPSGLPVSKGPRSSVPPLPWQF